MHTSDTGVVRGRGRSGHAPVWPEEKVVFVVRAALRRRTERATQYGAGGEPVRGVLAKLFCECVDGLFHLVTTVRYDVAR